MSTASTADLEIAPVRPLLKPLVATACVALAAWLFYGWTMGVSLPLFLGVLGVAAITVNRVHAVRHIPIFVAVIFVAGLLALIEDVSCLSVIVGTLATAMFANILTAPDARSWQRHMFESATIFFRGPFQLFGDFARSRRRSHPRQNRSGLSAPGEAGARFEIQAAAKRFADRADAARSRAGYAEFDPAAGHCRRNLYWRVRDPGADAAYRH